MVFLILLAIAFGTAAGLILLVVGVLEAPWPVLLGILVLGLMATQRISKEGQSLHQDMTTFSNHAQTKHQTKHRGSPDSAKHTSHSKVGDATSGKSAQVSSDVIYRGVAYRGDHSVGLTDGAIAQGLRYRGVAYGESKSSQATPNAPQPHGSEDEAKKSQDPQGTDKKTSLEHQSSQSGSPNSDQVSSTDVTPAPHRVTLVEGTYRGRHWEKVVSLPPEQGTSSPHSTPNSSSMNG